MHEATLVKFKRHETVGEHAVKVDFDLPFPEESVQVIEQLMAILEPDNQLVTPVSDMPRGERSSFKSESPAQMAKRLGFSHISYEKNGTTHSVIS